MASGERWEGLIMAEVSVAQCRTFDDGCDVVDAVDDEAKDG